MSDNERKINSITKFIGDINITKKIILLITIPVLAVSLYLYSALSDKLITLENAGRVQNLTEYVINASLLVHELQKERGTSAVYLGSKGRQMSSELGIQKRDSDWAYKNFQDFHENFDDSEFMDVFRDDLSSAKQNLLNLNNIRNQVQNQSTSKGNAIKFYTETITYFISSFQKVILMADHPLISNPVSAYVNIISAKEMAGIERARTATLAAVDKAISGDELIAWMTVWKSQETLLNNFQYLASENVLKFYQNNYRGPIVDNVKTIRQTLLDHLAEGQFGLDGATVFKKTTKRIDLLKRIEDKQSEEIQNIAEEIAAEAKQSLISNIALGLIVLLLTGVMSYLIISAITRPIQIMVEAMEALGNNDLTQKINIESKDEIGLMALSYNKAMKNLLNMFNQIKAGSEQIGNASTQLSTTSEELASGAEEQQSQLSDVAIAIEEMSAMILEASRNAGETQENASQANETAGMGQNTVQETIAGIEEIASIVQDSSDQINNLESRSNEIGEVIQVIEDIADQTNLLALNANIEAARAGDAGRGFAVVADEVRKLAERTVKATSEIGDMIKLIQTDVGSTVGAMSKIQNQSQQGQELAGQAGTALEEISGSIANVSNAVTQIASSAQEQSSGVEEISKNVENVSTVSRQAASAAQELAASSEELNREVQGLNDLIDQFKV